MAWRPGVLGLSKVVLCGTHHQLVLCSLFFQILMLRWKNHQIQGFWITALPHGGQMPWSSWSWNSLSQETNINKILMWDFGICYPAEPTLDCLKYLLTQSFLLLILSPPPLHPQPQAMLTILLWFDCQILTVLSKPSIKPLCHKDLRKRIHYKERWRGHLFV